MLPDYSDVLKCPFCGGEKEVLALMSGNTCGGQSWSDVKTDYPMLPRVSPIQKCPICGKELGFDWWQGAMSTAPKSSFTGLDVVLPCCNKASSLNELDYDFKCGFASCEIDIVNPAKNIDDELIEAISKLLACDISVVIARY